MYEEFARVAETQPFAWNYGKPAATKDVIGTVAKRNRMICFPCRSLIVVAMRIRIGLTDL